MEPFSKLRPPDAVRIKVKIAQVFNYIDHVNNSYKSQCSTIAASNTISSTCSNASSINCKKFCVDPQITSYEILVDLIAQAFCIHELVKKYIKKFTFKINCFKKIFSKRFSNDLFKS